MPTSYERSLAVPPSTASPFIVAIKSSETKSPFSTAFSTVVKVPKRARSASTCSATSASETTTSSTVKVIFEKSGSFSSGRTSTSAVNENFSRSTNSVTSIFGRPITKTFCSLSAAP